MRPMQAPTPSASEPRREGEPLLEWSTGNVPPPVGPSADGVLVLSFPEVRDRHIRPARAAGTRRTSLANPAQPLLDMLRSAREIVLTDVALPDVDAVRDLYGYILEPAWRAGNRIRVQADRPLDSLDPAVLADPDMGYPWTLERLGHLTGLMLRGVNPPRPPGEPAPATRLDPRQLAAVTAPGGVVQVIAPAGSGKTTVLVERARELARRGADPGRILALTFNRAAALEMQNRFRAAGIHGVQARTFHSLGYTILSEERMLRGKTRTLTLGQWRRLCAAVANRNEWIDPAEARDAISNIKLARMLTPSEHRQTLRSDPHEEAIAALYELYEREQRSEGFHDFDDQILLAVRALRDDPAVRARWQRKFACVLLDEHQDTEPAQEIMLRTLAAPNDSLFAVGDPDQTLYSFRRASVERLVAFDQVYPGLHRVALETNYRCPAAVVDASAKLIRHNQVRFPQPIKPSTHSPQDKGRLALASHRSSHQAAAWAAARLAERRRGEITVLARTTRLLRDVAEACIPLGVRISAPPRVFEAQGARAVIEAHLRLAAHPHEATPQDVAFVMRHPSRGMHPGDEIPVAARLRDGASWETALARQSAGSARITDAAVLLDTLAQITDAPPFIRLLRGPWGLERHFKEWDRTMGGVEQIEMEELDAAERGAKGKTVRELADIAHQRAQDLLFLRDDDHGLELCTVHGAKGREWPEVIIYGFETDQLPHARALDVTLDEEARGEGIEAERRIAYVAITRARDRLHILAEAGSVSEFAKDAGLRP